MSRKLIRLLERLATSLWLIPSLLSLAAAAMSVVLLFIDSEWPQLGNGNVWLFGGSSSAARSLLSSIAGSLITVVALAFSITILALQQASTQYSPRAMRTFMQDRGNQLVFGVYIATFAYALLVLRQVRDGAEGTAPFVPALSISGGMLLALICVALLIYYIDHVSTSLQVETIIDNIRHELHAALDRLVPEDGPQAKDEDTDSGFCELPAQPSSYTIHALGGGFLQAIDEAILDRASDQGITLVRIRPQFGDYVLGRAALVDVWCNDKADGTGLGACIGGAFQFGRERLPQRDVLFGIRQLVDVALKALSPGINDPTTAEQCISALGDVVAALAARPEPLRSARLPRSGIIVVFNRTGFTQVVDQAFSQIRREAAGDVHVTAHFLTVLAAIADQTRSVAQTTAIRLQAEAVGAALERQDFSEGDRAALMQHVAEVFAALQRTCEAAAANAPEPSR
ncbi:MAG: DUF2254 domain-containing protein [Dehalococcoidia bacterium]